MGANGTSHAGEKNGIPSQNELFAQASQEAKTTTAARPAGDATEEATATSRAPSATVLAAAGDIMPLFTPVAGERETTVPTPAGTTSPSATTVTQITAHLTEAELQSATTQALMSGSTEAAISAMREEQLAPGPVRRPTLLELPESSA